MKVEGRAEKKPRLAEAESVVLPAGPSRDPNSLDKAGLMTRSERAEYLRTIRKADRELLEKINSDRFLHDWLAQAQKDRQVYESRRENFTDAELTAMATHAGFRTSKAWLAALKDLDDLYRHFVYAEPFKQLWSLFKKYQRSTNVFLCYSPSNSGVPRKLVDAVLTWHQSPKFTLAERRSHSKKIAEASQVLEELLGQIEPSHSLDGQYSRFLFHDKPQAGALYRAFGVSPEKDDKNPFFGTQWNASHRLQFGSVVPLWAVQNIKRMALEGEPKSNPLPAKIRAKAAKKTYYIGVVSAILKNAVYQTDVDFQIKTQLIADIVGLLSGTDCTADDVRKATK